MPSVSAIGSNVFGLMNTYLMQRPPSARGARQAGPAQAVSKIFEKKDVNGDKSLTPDEVQLPAEKFQVIDADGSGSLEPAELLGHLQQQLGARQMQHNVQAQIIQGVQAFFQEHDQDGDGVLTNEELPIPGEEFARLDLDGDGAVNVEEFVQHVQQTREGLEQTFGTQVENLIREKDADGDGALSISELPLPEGEFQRIDADGDGLLQPPELVGEMARQHAAQQRGGFIRSQILRNVGQVFGERDIDGDGMLSPEELSVPAEAFQQIDANGDGFVEPAEMAQVMRERIAERFRQEQSAAGSPETPSSTFDQIA
ncbi:MAG: EF-hand domain-containing protein [Planctomycetota bacterium]|jgi:Ca2+-binding EF-hand superfamily protein